MDAEAEKGMGKIRDRLEEMRGECTEKCSGECARECSGGISGK